MKRIKNSTTGTRIYSAVNCEGIQEIALKAPHRFMLKVHLVEKYEEIFSFSAFYLHVHLTIKMWKGPDVHSAKKLPPRQSCE